MGILNLSPVGRLPVNLNRDSAGGRLGVELGWSEGASVFLRNGHKDTSVALAPLDNQTGSGEKRLASEGGALETGQLPGIEVPDPALNDLAGARGLLAGNDGGFVENRHDGQAGPDAAGEVHDGSAGRFLLQLAERVSLVVELGEVASLVLLGVRWGRGPAEERVGVEVVQQAFRYFGADGGHGCGVSGVIGSNVESTADQRGKGDQVLPGSVLGARERVPFHGEGVGQARLAER